MKITSKIIRNTKPVLRNFRGAKILTKQNTALKQINSYACSLIVASKPQKLCQYLPRKATLDAVLVLNIQHLNLGQRDKNKNLCKILNLLKKNLI